MKTGSKVFLPVFCVAATLVLGVDSVSAQAHSPLAALEASDSNNDGVVTREEMIEHRRTQFEQVDIDRNGFMSSGEMAAVPGVGARAAQYVAFLDVDGDDQLSEDEFAQGRAPVFDRLDGDGNNIVDQAEFAAARAQSRP